MRRNLSLGIGSLLLIALPLAGAVVGAILGHVHARPTEPVCGNFVSAYIPFVAVAAFLGFAIAVAMGCGGALALIRWANRSWVEVDTGQEFSRE
jgi:hypothetical protein